MTRRLFRDARLPLQEEYLRHVIFAACSALMAAGFPHFQSAAAAEPAAGYLVRPIRVVIAQQAGSSIDTSSIASVRARACINSNARMSSRKSDRMF